MKREIESYESSFVDAQQLFEGQLDSTDRSRLVIPSNIQTARDFLTENGQLASGFYEIIVDADSLQYGTELVVNRALLIYNSKFDALSPAVITQDQEHPSRFQITMLNQPYDPAIGFSPGMHFGLSAKAQTKVAGFGGHGKRGGFEQGHFGAVLLGARNEEIGSKLKESGDNATHKVLETGLSENMARQQMIDLPLITKQLPVEKVKLQLYWHPGLETQDGPASADYPNATKLLLGAGVQALGAAGLEQARVLVDDAIRGVE